MAKVEGEVQVVVAPAPFCWGSLPPVASSRSVSTIVSQQDGQNSRSAT